VLACRLQPAHIAAGAIAAEGTDFPLDLQGGALIAAPGMGHRRLTPDTGYC